VHIRQLAAVMIFDTITRSLCTKSERERENERENEQGRDRDRDRDRERERGGVRE